MLGEEDDVKMLCTRHLVLKSTPLMPMRSQTDNLLSVEIESIRHF